MYGIPVDGHVRLQTNDSLREFARLEYPAEDVLWLRSTVKAAARPRRAVPRFRLFARRAPRAHTPVAHKGTPRGRLVEVAGPS